MKRILVVAGGEWQIPIVKTAKAMEFDVFNSNLLTDSPAFQFADHSLVVDVLDIEQNVQYAKISKIDAVVTDQSDIAVPTVAAIADNLGIPGIGKKIATLFTDKLEMRNFCRQNNYPTPHYRHCHSISDVILFAKVNGYPFIVKPPANQSSRGVHKVASADELEACYKSATLHSRGMGVIAESYIPGTEITIDGIKCNAGEHYSLAISSKQHYSHNETIAKRLIFSNAHDTIDYELLRKQHNEMIQAMGLPFGLTHAEYKFHDGKFYLIEVAARGGGTLISSDIVPMMSGVNTNELLIRMACGESISSIECHTSNKVTALSFLSFQSGKVKSISGLKTARRYPGVHKINLNFDINSNLHPPEDDRSRHGFVICSADDHNQLNNLIEKIEQTIRIEYE